MRAVMSSEPEDDATAEFRVAAARRPRADVRLRLPLDLRRGRDRVGLRGTVKDVTEARLAEAALRRSEERFRQGFDNAPIAMSLVDPGDHALRARQRRLLRAWSGRTREALLELSSAEISHPDDRPRSAGPAASSSAAT